MKRWWLALLLIASPVWAADPPSVWRHVYVDPTGMQAPYGFAFQVGAWDTSRREYQTLDSSPQFTVTWRYSAAANAWTSRTDGGADGGPSGTGTTHNCSQTYDSLQDRVWLAACGPMAVVGHWYWTVANGWFRYTMDPQPLGADALQAFDPRPSQRLLYLIGGWGGALHLLFSFLTTQTTTDTWNLVASWDPTMGQGPLFLETDLLTCGPGCSTFLRGGWDSATNRLWVVDTRSDVWTIDPTAPSPAWVKRVVTTQQPPEATAYVLDAQNHRIVGLGGEGRGGASPATGPASARSARPPRTIRPRHTRGGGGDCDEPCAGTARCAASSRLDRAWATPHPRPSWAGGARRMGSRAAPDSGRGFLEIVRGRAGRLASSGRSRRPSARGADALPRRGAESERPNPGNWNQLGTGVAGTFVNRYLHAAL